MPKPRPVRDRREGLYHEGEAVALVALVSSQG